MSRSDTPTTKVYVGNLPDDAKKEELEREFERYGKLHDVWVARNPPGFAFVEFYDARDAKDAVNELDGQRLCGAVVKVELSHGRGRSGSRGGGGRGRSSRDRYGGPRDRDGYDRRDGGYDRRGSRNRSGSPMYRRRSPVQQQRGWKDRSRSRSPPVRF